MMSPRRMACALALTAVAATSCPAAAQPESSSSESTFLTLWKSAEEHRKEGVRFYEAKKWAEAEREFEQAWALNPTVDVAYNLGNAEFRQAKFRDAAEHLAFALRGWPLMEAMSSQRPIAEKRLAESRTHVGALTVKANVAGADVLVDGQVVGKTPLPGEVFVEPGAHTVEVKLKGYLGDNETVQLEKGAAKSMELRLIQPMPMDVGPEKARAEQPPTTGQSAEAPPEEGLRKKLIIAGIATSAALVTGGVVVTLLANGKADDADQQRAMIAAAGGNLACEATKFKADCDVLHGLRKDASTFTNIAGWMFIGAGVVGAGTLIYALVSSQEAPASAVRVEPVVVGSAGGVRIVGRW